MYTSRYTYCPKWYTLSVVSSELMRQFPLSYLTAFPCGQCGNDAGIYLTRDSWALQCRFCGHRSFIPNLAMGRMRGNVPVVQRSRSELNARAAFEQAMVDCVVPKS